MDNKSALEQIKSNGNNNCCSSCTFWHSYNHPICAPLCFITENWCRENEYPLSEGTCVSPQVLQATGYPLSPELVAGVIRDYLKDQMIPNPCGLCRWSCRDWWAGFLSERSHSICLWNVLGLWHLRWLMSGLLMLRNCFRSQGNVAMHVGKDFSDRSWIWYISESTGRKRQPEGG